MQMRYRSEISAVYIYLNFIIRTTYSIHIAEYKFISSTGDDKYKQKVTEPLRQEILMKIKWNIMECALTGISVVVIDMN